ncbi:MAG TPA: flagellar hook-basal body complex protein FliE [Casimicrobiaceae bacterium]|jgi:flagellar hook-basal body complex protein FliE|nr:flagellar hook-basal body complex protein FliE [Casimicrobiaceae bacterium]
MDPVGMQSLLAKLNAARDALTQGVGPAVGPLAARIEPSAAKQVDFGSLLKKSLDSVDAAQQQATSLTEKFQLGDPKVSLEETMVAVQKASLSFQQVVQIRNRVIAAYHDVMNMQV